MVPEVDGLIDGSAKGSSRVVQQMHPPDAVAMLLLKV
jgi:hypothetical protein